MATTTPNFGWDIPQSTDLVKDGATAIAALGNDIDTSMVDLKGGTTGQILTKASNTDMDFTWSSETDPNAISKTIVDAKGDIITATAADTPARLAVGSSGNLLVADSSAATGLAYSPTFFAGKNKIINGDFGIWQRGTSGFSTGAAYNADRWAFYRDGTGGTSTISQQTFTAGTAPVSGYEGQFFWRYAVTVAWSGQTESFLYQRIEDVRTFANQTVTLSFWAKADASRTITGYIRQNFGSGGSASVDTSFTSQSITTSWARYSVTITLPSVSGKTIGTSSFLQVTLGTPLNTTQTIDIWGVQLEAGSTATQFQTATGTIQGELAACQRYYYRQGGDSVYQLFGNGIAYTTTGILVNVPLPVTMRTTPSGTLDYSTLAVQDGTNVLAISSLSSLSMGKNAGSLAAAVTGATQWQPYAMCANNSTNAYIGISAEL